MKNPAPLCLAAGILITLNSCYTWTPPPQKLPPGPSGASLDAPPGNTRYMGGPDAPLNPNDPLAPVDPSAVQTPQPTDPNAPIPPPPVPPVDPSAPIVAPPPTPPGPLPSTTASAPKSNELPYGIKVPNKPGFVYSPYDKTAGIVDVMGFAPGTKVKCPYTHKVFLVP